MQDKSIAWLSMLISCTRYSPCCSAKISDTPPPAKKIKDKEEFILVHSWRVQSITEGKPRWQDAEGVGHVTSAFRKQRKASFLSPRYLVWNSSSEKVSSTWGGSARLSKPSLEACSQTSSVVCFHDDSKKTTRKSHHTKPHRCWCFSTLLLGGIEDARQVLNTMIQGDGQLF